jgi:DUF1009 family protein
LLHSSRGRSAGFVADPYAEARSARSAPTGGFVKKLGLIAGNGKFPLIFAEEAKRAGFFVVAVAHRGETDAAIETFADKVTWVYVGQLGKIIRAFQQSEVSEAVMAGGIRKVKLFGNFRPDLRGARFLARLKSREDDALLRGIADELASDGIRILESTLCLPQMIAGEGVLSRRAPRGDEWEDIKLGFDMAKEIGRLGIGQTVIVKKQVVLAVEAVEGTDAAIQRAGALAESGCVVVKVSKPQQDLRFDVPAVGVDTMERLHEIEAAVLAVEAGKTILLEKEELLRRADKFDIAVVGVSAASQ